MQLFEEMSYKIGRDFNLTIALDFLDFYSKQEVIEINELILTEKASKLIEFEEIITLIAGICYSITPINEMGKRQYNIFHIKFDDSLPSEDIPTIELPTAITKSVFSTHSSNLAKFSFFSY